MNTKRRTIRMGLAAIAASSALVLGACGGGATGGNQAQSPNQAQPPANQNGQNNAGAGNASGSSCVAASQILSNTQSFAGKPVTVTGTVGQTIGQHAFAVAINSSNSNSNSNNSGGGIVGGNNSNSGANTNGQQMLLAVAKQPSGIPTQGSPVQITGVLQPTFDANQAATFTGGNLDQDKTSFTAWNGKPYVQAAWAGPISTNLTSGQSGSVLGGNSSGNNCAQASGVLDNTQSYAGQQVTLTGTVGQAIGPNAFTISANNNTGGNTGNNAQTLLAVAKETTGMPTPGSPIQVTGTLQPTFDMNQAVAFTGGNLDQAALNAYNGKPYVQAAWAGPVSANLTNGQGGS